MAYQTWKEVLPNEVSKTMKKGSAVNILDVRESEEWVSGHIPGARHLPLSQLPVRTAELDRDAEYVIVCQSGGRSTRACEYLTAMGYRVINMSGGMSRWTGALTYGK